MEIRRKIDTTNATYDFMGLTDEQFMTLVKAYEHYQHYIRHSPPADDDSMWAKMLKLTQDRITIV